MKSNGMAWAGEARLNAGPGLAQMNRMSADIPEFQDPVFAERALYGQIPLLGVGHDEMPGNRQAKDELRRKNTRATTGAAIVRKLCDVAAVRKALKDSEAGDESRIERACLRQRIDAGLKKIGETARR